MHLYTQHTGYICNLLAHLLLAHSFSLLLLHQHLLLRLLHRRLRVIPYGQLKRSNRRYTFPKTFSFELRFWHNFVPDMPDSSEKLTFQGPPNPGGLHYSVPPPD